MASDQGMGQGVPAQEGGGSGWGRYYRVATQYANSAMQATAGDGTPRERGSRRKKLAGYLQAANDLRQSYTAGYANRSAPANEDDWPQMGTVRTDDGELVLFPSYARMRPKSQPGEEQVTREHPESYHQEWMMDETGEWDAIIEVDVRGWLYAPHSGPMNRKSRYGLWVARQLCGLPAQTAADSADSQGGLTAEEAEAARQEATAIARDVDARQPQGETGAAPDAGRRGYWRSTTESNVQPQMSPAEVKAAHAAFNARLAPFMYRSIAGSPITVFFYNETASQSRSLLTSENGHFSIRAQLPFIPSHVRVLVSETLSATEEICLHPPDGISLISDVDDTVKHSAISMGTREVFKNTFTAPLPSLVIPGVAQWYRKLANPPYDVSIHYISNSPWQLYPLLKSFFQETGLPPGSFHLKQYSGMLQSIFEPAAERKKGTVDRVIADFPNRKWILVGDSGESDLEVYTEVAERFPDRILAICIRDVTTTAEAQFFDSNSAPAPEATRGPPPKPSYKIMPPPEPGSLKPSQSTPDLSSSRLGRSQYTYNSSSYALSSSLSSGSSSPNLKSVTTLPHRPEKPSHLRSPPIPSKPSHLQQKLRAPATTAGLDHSPLYDGHEYPSSPPSAPAAGPPRRVATSAAPPPPPPRRTPQRVNTNASLASTTSTATTDPAVSKREELWTRRWAAAQERLKRNAANVKLISWRVGADAEGMVLEILNKELVIGGKGWGPSEGPPPPGGLSRSVTNAV